jgi:HEXXH motif-containing protein
MKLMDARSLDRLRTEFHRSMRNLLKDLCRDFERNYVEAAQAFRLPIKWFFYLEHSLRLEEFGHEKIVGWIESLNDLLYFIDIVGQVQRERFRGEIAEQLRVEFKEKFYEHGYADEIFPQGKPEPRRLLTRLTDLCRRLSRDVTQESVCLAPHLACQWLATQGPHRRWLVSCDLSANFERVELQGVCVIGTAGLSYEAPRPVRQALIRVGGQATFRIKASGIDLLVGKQSYTMVETGHVARWHWRRVDPQPLKETGRGALLLGPTLLYGRQQIPMAVKPTRPEVATRMQRALSVIESAWPEGYRLLMLLTSRIIPLKASGVVSFSYRHRPGMSVINCYDRDQLDLIDDLIHENSHHHLNLLLRKDVLHQNDHHQEIFYSPWRRRLRPLRGILHATFTFTMGAMLFERLSAWAETKQGRTQWREVGLTPRDLMRARFRCFEEMSSVRYSLQDLAYAGCRLKWLTGMGQRIVDELATSLRQVERRMRKHQERVDRSSFGPALRRHRAELVRARKTYGLMEAGFSGHREGRQ